MKWLNKKGFTLLELLVVVLIIGILSAIAIPQYKKAVEKTRLTEAFTAASSLQKAMDMYILAKGYPVDNKTIYFLNDEPDEILDIDFTQTLTCNPRLCYSKLFNYYGYCNKNECYLFIERIRSGNNSQYLGGNDMYDLTYYKRKDDDSWQGICTCSTSMQYVCGWLEDQGFETRECC